jgi:hypothetical protein
MQTTNSEAAIWERVIHPDAPMSRATAQSILKLEFSDEERQRMHDLGGTQPRREARAG